MQIYIAYGVGIALGLTCILVLETIEARRGGESR